MTDDTHDRLAQLNGVPHRDDSLVGSYFHADGKRGWQGCVVAEPSPGVYLVELFGWLAGDSTGQQLVRIEEMLHWTFYDNADWMNNAYTHGGVKERWERERGEDSSTGG